MKASEYIARNRARRAECDRQRGRWRYDPRFAPRVSAGPAGIILSGTLDDIDTPEKRAAIADAVMGRGVR